MAPQTQTRTRTRTQAGQQAKSRTRGAGKARAHHGRPAGKAKAKASGKTTSRMTGKRTPASRTFFGQVGRTLARVGNITPKQWEALSSMLGILEHEGECSPALLVDQLSITNATAANRAGLLKRWGLLNVRKEGRNAFYSLSDQGRAFYAAAECIHNLQTQQTQQAQQTEVGGDSSTPQA